MTIHNGEYDVQAGTLDIEKAVDLVPGQQELNNQMQASQENQLAEMQANSKESLRLLDNLIADTKGFGTALTDYLQQKREKARKDRETELQLRTVMFGVDEQTARSFEEDEAALFEDHLEINKEANKIEEVTDAITAQEFRDLSGWEQTIVAKQWALNTAKNYPLFIAQHLETEVLEMQDGRKITYANADIHQKKAIEAQVKTKFMEQFGGLNEALVAKVVKPEIDLFEQANDRENRAAANQAIKDKRKANEVESLKTFTVQADLNQAVVDSERWITEYIANNNTTRFKAEEAYAANLIKLVETGQLPMGGVLKTVFHEYEGRSGKRRLTSGKGMGYDFIGRLQEAHVKWETTKEADLKNKIAGDVALILEMGDKSEEQLVELEALFKAMPEYAGALPPEIQSALRGHIDDYTARRHLESAKAAQNGKVYDYQLARVSDTVRDEYKKDIAGPGVLADSNESSLLNKQLKALTDLGAGNAIGDENESIEWLTLHARLQSEFQKKYERELKATESHDTALENTLRYLHDSLDNDKTLAEWTQPAWKNELLPGEEDEQAEYAHMIRSGYNQGINGKWRKEKISLTKKDEQALVDWSQGDKKVSDIPPAYLDLARRLHLIPADLVKAQLRFLSEEEVEIDENVLLKNEAIIDLLKTRTRSSLAQAYAIHNQGDIETNAKTDVFNKKGLTNPDI